MKTVIVVNIGGKSHPDLLKKLTSESVKLGASWLNSKVNYLAGFVSALIKIEVDTNKLEQLKELFLQFEDVTASFYDSPDELVDSQTELKLAVDAEDRAGLVNELIYVFHEAGAEVLNLNSHRLYPFGLDHSVFTAEISLSCPSQLPHEELVQRIKSLGADVKINLIE